MMRLENRDIVTLAKKVAGAKSIASTFSFNGRRIQCRSS